MTILNRLRQTDLLAGPYRAYKNLVSGRGWGAFHHDPIYQRTVLDLLDALPFTSFVETGTYRGYSTEFVAMNRPQLPVFTSEVLESTYRVARRALRRYRNITQYLGSSDAFIRELLEGKVRAPGGGDAGEMPLYYLDAHWQRYWPLRDELRHITGRGQQTVILIDDFEVPGQPQFDFDVDGGAEIVEGEKCNLDYIRVALSPRNTYHAVFPKYTRADAFGSPTAEGLMRGHVLLFQNLPEAYESYLARPHARANYFGHGPAPVGPAAAQPGATAAPALST